VAFIGHYQQLYPPAHVIYNLHALSHLAQQVKQFGALDNISCFPFENFLGRIKKLVRGPNRPLAQVIRRLTEINSSNKTVVENVENVETHEEHFSGPLPETYALTYASQYKRLSLRTSNKQSTVLRVREPDSCVRTRKSYGILRNFLRISGDCFVIFQRFRSVERFFSYPSASDKLELSLH
jgi:hypothetical protein